jgi:iron only hydrogenase large subunit-like protein
MSKVSTGEMKMNGYHYIEAMACPSGCLNGGGQTHALDDKKRERPSEMKSRVEKTRNFIANFLPSATLQGFQADEALHQHIRTRFHVVPKLELTMGAASGVAVENTHW